MPDAFYLREVVRSTGAGQGAVQREFQRLERAGIFRRLARGRQVFFQANAECPVSTELRGIVLKTAGVAEALRQALEPLAERIRLAFVYGSVARGDPRQGSDVDLCVVGEVTFAEVAAARSAGGCWSRKTAACGVRACRSWSVGSDIAAEHTTGIPRRVTERHRRWVREVYPGLRRQPVGRNPRAVARGRASMPERSKTQCSGARAWICRQCHSGHFAQGELEKGDAMIRQVDHLMAEAIRIVAALYKDGVLAQPKTYAHPFPDLLTFHANPDYAMWYGWSEVQRDLTEIKAQAEELRFRKTVRAEPAPPTPSRFSEG